MSVDSPGINVVSIGELLWDLLPEARQLGGAPANFAYHAHDSRSDRSETHPKKVAELESLFNAWDAERFSRKK